MLYHKVVKSNTKMDAKELLGYAGKTIATIACPPAGLALFPKDIKDRIAAGLSGVILSFISSLIISSPPQTVYDNPKIETRKYDCVSYKGLASSVVSPFLYLYLSHDSTKITSAEKQTRVVKGRDVVVFDNGRYNLNFGPEREFQFDQEGFDFNSIEKARKAYEKYANEGNLIEARKAKAGLESVTQRHDKIKTEFQSAIDKMNSELEQMSAEGDKK